MPTEMTELESVLRDLFSGQRYGVLGTQGAERVSLNLMAVAATDDLRFLILATERATTKYANLRHDPQVSLLVDNRANRSDDTQTALAVTVDGLAEEVSGPEREELEQLLLSRHPQLGAFVHSPTCSLFRVRVERYELVRGLYDVRTMLMTQ
jgi:heme iron utilization protein